MNSQMPDRKTSPNDFPPQIPFNSFAAQNFMPIAPIAPLSTTLPLFTKKPLYGNIADKFGDTASGGSYNVKGDFGSSRGSSRQYGITSEQFTKVAMRGCNIAEKIVHNHKNRPCFKKIDSLCARLKQDLVRADSVMANINSQGVAWAVKDMIFTFTRIINAWIIVKGYMYDVPPGLRKVKQSCAEGFDESFYKWQDATVDFLENLTNSFESLDTLVQIQKNRLGANGKNIDDRKRDMSDDDDFFEDLTQTSVMRMLSNISNDRKDDGQDSSYIRTGIYSTLQGATSNLQVDPQQLLMWEQNVFPRTDAGSPEKPIKILAKPIPGTHNEAYPGTKIPISFLSDKYKEDQVNSEDTLILILLSKLYEMKDASLFFNKHFTKNYIPEYVNSAFNCKDTKTIMILIEKHSYGSFAEIIKDLGAILYDAKTYLKKNPNCGFLASNTKAFENELKTILSEDIFSNYDFTSIFLNP